MSTIKSDIEGDFLDLMRLDEGEPCPGCGDGDKVPAHGYWRCPVCDAEWGDEGEDGEDQ